MGQKILCWIFCLFLMAVAARSQSRVDSFYTPYDSIQDLKRQRAERAWARQIQGIAEQLAESARLNDSLAGEVGSLTGRIGALEGENNKLKGEVGELEVLLEERTRESDHYRQRLQTILWITGALLLLLLLGSFLFLLQYSLRTRQLVRTVRARLKRLQKAVKRQQEELSNLPEMGKRRVRKIASREIKTRMKKSRFRKKNK